MKTAVAISISILFFSMSCRNDIQPTQLSTTIDSLTLSDTITAQAISAVEDDTLFTNGKIIFDIIPSDKYLDSIQKVCPEDEWSEIVSDNQYYSDLTQQYLKMKGYQYLPNPEKKRWHFRLKNGSIQIILPEYFYDT